MAAPAILTQGTTFSIDDNLSAPVPILGVVSASGLGSGSASSIDTTTLDATAKTFRMGLQDFGEFALELIWNPDDLGQAELLEAMDTQAQRTFIVTLQATSPVVTLNVWTAEVYVLKMEFNIEADGVVKGSATIRVTGEPVWS